MGRSSREQRGKHVCHGSIKQLVFLFTAAVSLAAEDNGVTVSHIRNGTPGKRKTEAK